MSDLISRTDAIDAVQKIVPYVIDKDIGQWEMLVNKANVITELSALPSAEAVSLEEHVKELNDLAVEWKVKFAKAEKTMAKVANECKECKERLQNDEI